LHRDIPDYVQFYPTLRCNLSCSFCFNRGIASRADVTVRDFERIVSVLSDQGIRELDILGGEPTLHPRFNELIETVSGSEIRTALSTNGHNNVRLLEDIHRRYGNDPVRVGVSVNSGDISRELHEYIVTYKPMVKSVYTRDRKVPASVRDYLSLSGLEYYLIFMDVIAREDLGNCLPFYEFFRDLDLFRKAHTNVSGVFCSGFIPDVAAYPVLEYVRCPAGTTKFSILPDGSVYPCYLFFRYEEFRIGNILSADFDKAWKSPKLDFFRRYEGNACTRRGCELFSLCHGGCPAVSLLIYGDLRAPDPRCVHLLP